MIVTQAKKEDFKEVVQLLNECSLAASRLTEHNMDDFLVIRSGRCIVGVTGLVRVGNVAAIGHSLAVAPGFRRMGLGRQLINSLMERGISEQIGAVYLFTCKAEYYFRALGFTVVPHDSVPSSVMDALAELCEPGVVMGGHILAQNVDLNVHEDSEISQSRSVA